VAADGLGQIVHPRDIWRSRNDRRSTRRGGGLHRPRVEDVFRDGKFDPDDQTIVLHLDSEQYALLEQALLAEGARLELKDVGAILDSHYLNRDSALGDPPFGRSKGEQRLPTDRPTAVGVSGDDLGKTV